MDWQEETQYARAFELLEEDTMKSMRYKEHKMRILKEDYPEKYADLELKTAEQLMEEKMKGGEKSTKRIPSSSGLTDEIERRLS